MPKFTLSRGARAAAATAALTLGLGGTAFAGGFPATAQQLHSSYDFQSTLGTSFGLSGAALTEFGTTTNVPGQDAIGVFSFGSPTPEPSRDLRQFDAGEGFAASTAGLTGPTFGVALTFNIDSPDPTMSDGEYARLLDFSGGTSDSGLYVKDARLSWYDGGDIVTGTTGILPDAWRHVVAVRNADGTLSVYLDGSSAPEITVPAANAPSLGATVRLFEDGNGTQESSGEIARLQLFSGELSSSQVAGLQPLDVSDPTVSLFSFTAPAEVIWLGPNSGIGASALDDGSGPVDLPYVITSIATGNVVSGGSITDGLSVDHQGPGNDRIATTGSTGIDPTGLENGHLYQFALAAKDKAGNASLEQYQEFGWDDQAPAGMTLAAPGPETSDRTPLFSGAAGTAARDDGVVHVSVCKGTSCDHGDESDFVGYVEGKVIDGRWSGELVKIVGDDHENPVAVGDLANGEYVAVAYQGDSAYNYAEAKRTFRVVDAPAEPPAVAPVVVPPTVAEPVVTPPAVSTPAPLTARELVTRLLQASVQQLAGEGLRGLTDHGGAALQLAADRPGKAIVQFFYGSAPKKAEPTAGASAKKKAKKSKTIKQKNLIGTGSRVFRAPGTGAVTVKLSKKGKARLKGRKKAKITVRTIFVPKSGAPVVQTQAVTVKR